MIIVTPSAREKLLNLIEEHPEDPVVRLSMKDLDEQRIAFSIMLESAPHPDDEVQECQGLTVAIEARRAARMDGITLDYMEPGGFKFLHPREPQQEKLRIINLN